jgi:TRAP-type C4-dicarboxylate transport system substrate-binding protein
MKVARWTMRGPVAALGIAAALALSAAGPAMAAGKTYVMKLSTATLNDTQHEYLKRLAAAVEKASNGQVKAQVYPASQLGSIQRQVEGVQFGSIQVYVGPPEFMAGIDPRFEVLSAPGVFDSMAHATKVIRDPEFSKAFLSIGAKKGLVGATLFMSAPTAFDMRQPIRHLADLRGKKVRVLASKFQMAQLSKLGAVGVPMTLGDVLPALQQGTIDGAMSVVPVLEALHYYDAAKYMTETNHSMVISEAVISKKWLDSLPANVRKLVVDQAAKVGPTVDDFAIKFFEDSRKRWKEHGGELIELPPAEHAKMMKALATVGPDVVKSSPPLKKIYDLMVATANRTRSK